MQAPPPAHAPAAAPSAPGRRARQRRALLWSALVALLLVAQTLLVVLTLRHEGQRMQEAAETVAAEAAAELRREVQQLTAALLALDWSAGPRGELPPASLESLVATRRELLRIEQRDAALRVRSVVESRARPPLFTALRRSELDIETELACSAAARHRAPRISRSYFVPSPDGLGLEVMDLCLPVLRDGEPVGFVVGTVGLAALLDSVLATPGAHTHEFSFVEADGSRLARAGFARGTGLYAAEQLVDLPGGILKLRADAAAGRPQLIPNLATALVLGLSVALFAVVVLLARDVRRRARAETALAEALAFRKAMEDSLSTGLRARDLAGRTTYVNPAFCAMVGWSEAELRAAEAPPYWPPEHAALYAERQRQRLTGEAGAPREGYETVFMRKSGERFPAMVYEAPLVDGDGRHAGWMGAVVDVSAQRRIEELSRQQQDRLQASARLATVGEMASLLSHELNQPLAAIASYASGSLNLIDDASDPGTPALLRQALDRIAEQAERAGRVIKSVHHFVRRRAADPETLSADALVEAVLPLVRLQARKSGTRVEVECPQPAPRLRCDRTMVEQVLLNLTRNGIQAMEEATPAADRLLAIRIGRPHPKWVAFDIDDAGSGIAPDVAARLFTPFFTTKGEGMGLGLSMCRTVVEQHGGALEVGPRPGGQGTRVRFTLPAATPPAGTTPAPAAAPGIDRPGQAVPSGPR